MAFGRPPAIPDQYVNLPLPENDDKIGRPVSPAQSWKAAGVPFFNATM